MGKPAGTHPRIVVIAPLQGYRYDAWGGERLFSNMKSSTGACHASDVERWLCGRAKAPGLWQDPCPHAKLVCHKEDRHWSSAGRSFYNPQGDLIINSPTTGGANRAILDHLVAFAWVAAGWCLHPLPGPPPSALMGPLHPHAVQCPSAWSTLHQSGQYDSAKLWRGKHAAMQPNNLLACIHAYY